MIKRIWNTLTSLKLAIVLASLATATLIAGSLIMHARPDLFGGLDQTTITQLYPRASQKAPLLSLWIPLSGLLITAFALNTLCCLIDWLTQIRRRWRKLGEYLIHLGFCLLVVAFFWGDLHGERETRRIFSDETTALEKSDGVQLRLDDLRPIVDEESGRPLDMINHLTLVKDGQEIARETIGANQPLIRDGYLVVPASFGQTTRGFTFLISGHPRTQLEPGTRLQLAKGKSLEVLEFAPHARSMGNRVINLSERLIEPAFHLRLSHGERTLWQGWYFLRRPLPETLREHDIVLRPLAPVEQTYTELTVNYDPAIRLAAAGGFCMTGGVFWALFSYYAKRRRQDRPDII